MKAKRGVFGAILITLVFTLAFGQQAAAAERQLPSNREQINLSFAPLVQRAAPAVVNIYTRKVVKTRQVAPLFRDPFFQRFFGKEFGFQLPGKKRKRVQNSLGSGVIIAANGLIVTNHHVIEGADEITVVLSDRREFDAVIEGTDERTDLAVLRIDAGKESFSFLELGDSDDLEVGDLVLAIGNPFGVGQTVTSGIVSALARTQVGISDLNSFIQTDAAINPGNSGGALITMNGRLVGVNSAIFSKSGGSLGIGFAIPSNMVRSVVAGLANGGHVVRPWLGALGQAVDADIAASFGMQRPSGVLVNSVHSKSPADRAGLSVGDVILAVNDREVVDARDLRYRVATLVVGQSADLKVWRNKKTNIIKVALEAPPEDPPADITDLAGSNPLSGTTVANMSPALAEELRLGSFEPGVIILRINRRSGAQRLGFRQGDMILKINGKSVKSTAFLKSFLDRRLKRLEITIKRNGRTISRVFNK